MTNSRPTVISYNVASINGRVGPFMFPDRAWFALAGQPMLTEAEHQVEIVGAYTMWPFHDLPRPAAAASVGPDVDLFGHYRQDSLSTNNGPVRAITDSRGRLPEDAFGEDNGRLLAANRLVVLTAASTPPTYLSSLRLHAIPYLVVGADRVDLAGALEWFGAELDARVVASNSGGSLNAALLSGGLLDEIWIELVPAVIPYIDCATMFDGPQLPSDYRTTSLELIDVNADDRGRIAIRYRILTPATTIA